MSLIECMLFYFAIGSSAFFHFVSEPGPGVIKRFSCLTQLDMKF